MFRRTGRYLGCAAAVLRCTLPHLGCMAPVCWHGQPLSPSTTGSRTCHLAFLTTKSAVKNTTVRRSCQRHASAREVFHPPPPPSPLMCKQSFIAGSKICLLTAQAICRTVRALSICLSVCSLFCRSGSPCPCLCSKRLYYSVKQLVHRCARCTQCACGAMAAPSDVRLVHTHKRRMDNRIDREVCVDKRVGGLKWACNSGPCHPAGVQVGLEVSNGFLSGLSLQHTSH